MSKIPFLKTLAAAGLIAAHSLALAQAASPLNNPALFDPAAIMADPISATASLITNNAPNLPPSQRVIMPTFRVVFAVRANGVANTAFVGGPGSGQLSGSFVLKLDEGTMQAITESAYRQFLKALQARGAEVVTADQITDPFARERIGARSIASPARFSAGTARGNYTAFVPAGVPLYVGNQDAGLLEIGNFSQRMTGIVYESVEGAEAKLAGDYQAVVIRPTIWLEFIETSSRFGGFGGFAGGPGAAEPGLRITAGATQVVVTHPAQLRKVPRSGLDAIWSRENFLSGSLAVMGLRQTLQPRDSGVAKVSDGSDPQGGGSARVASVLGSILGGGAGTGVRARGYEVLVDPERYRSAAEASLSALVEMWASKITMR